MIEKAPFGSTGHESTRTIFGAAALGDVTQAEADRTLELLLEHGINHIDTAAQLRRLGAAARRRGWRSTASEFFLATKTGRAHLRRRARPDPPLAGAPAASIRST